MKLRSGSALHKMMCCRSQCAGVFIRVQIGKASENGADHLCADLLRKADFWQRCAGESFTDRQKIMLNRFPDGFEGKLTARKWAAIGKCPIASAQRDISDLLERGILKRNQGGSKNTSYNVTQ